MPPERGALRRVLVAVTALAFLLLLAGFGARLHPAGDTIGVFRVPLAVITMAGALVLWRPLPATLPVALIAAAALVPHLPGPAPEEPAEPMLTLYQQNLLYSRTDHAAFVGEIRRQAPDVITLQEVSEQNVAIIDALSDLYPHRKFCPVGDRFGEAVLSRLPIEGDSVDCLPGGSLALLRVRTEAGPVWIGSVHLNWPWPRGQAREVDKLLPVLEGLEGPVLLAGDFNAVPWSHTVRRMARAIGARRAGPGGASFVLPFIHLPVTIDHIVAPEGFDGGAKVMPRLGSDHRGVFAWLDRAPQ